MQQVGCFRTPKNKRCHFVEEKDCSDLWHRFREYISWVPKEPFGSSLSFSPRPLLLLLYAQLGVRLLFQRAQGWQQVV
ncbi:hypothetical protein AMELA_G00028310, partial [Ameiurus melas]